MHCKNEIYGYFLISWTEKRSLLKSQVPIWCISLFKGLEVFLSLAVLASLPLFRTVWMWMWMWMWCFVLEVYVNWFTDSANPWKCFLLQPICEQDIFKEKWKK